MDGISLMASAMHAARARLDVSAANLANVSSGGFHRHVAHAMLTRGGLVATSAPDDKPGPLRATGRAFDLATAGSGGFVVRDPSGATHTVRSASFERDARDRLVDERGRVLMGARGPIVVGDGATIDARGIVHDGERAAQPIRTLPGSEVRSGFVETANVDAVGEMVDVLGAQRAFETAQKTLGALDEERQKDVNDVVRVKA